MIVATVEQIPLFFAKFFIAQKFREHASMKHIFVEASPLCEFCGHFGLPARETG